MFENNVQLETVMLLNMAEDGMLSLVRQCKNLKKLSVNYYDYDMEEELLKVNSIIHINLYEILTFVTVRFTTD